MRKIEKKKNTTIIKEEKAIKDLYLSNNLIAIIGVVTYQLKISLIMLAGVIAEFYMNLPVTETNIESKVITEMIETCPRIAFIGSITALIVGIIYLIINHVLSENKQKRGLIILSLIGLIIVAIQIYQIATMLLV